jgi:cardiolipin synthase
LNALLVNLPNLITVLRAALIPVIAWRLAAGDFGAALALFFVSAASDAADGWIARRWRLRTRFGAIADPLADKATMLTVTLLLAWLGALPLWLAALLVARDLVIVAGALAYHFVVGHVEMAPTLLSKANTGLEFVMLAAALAHAAGLAPSAAAWLPALYAVVALTIVLSGAQYVWVWGRKAARARRGPGPRTTPPSPPTP